MSPEPLESLWNSPDASPSRPSADTQRPNGGPGTGEIIHEQDTGNDRAGLGRVGRARAARIRGSETDTVVATGTQVSFNSSGKWYITKQSTGALVGGIDVNTSHLWGGACA